MQLAQRKELVFVLSGVLLAIILVVGVLWLWADEDEVIIRRTLDTLVENVNKAGDETPFVLMMDAQEIMKAFAEEPEIHFGPPVPPLTDREELQAFIYQARNNLTTINIELHEVEVDVAEDRQSALVELLADATVTYQGETQREARRFRLTWIREDGKWVIQEAELLDRQHQEGDPGLWP